VIVLGFVLIVVAVVAAVILISQNAGNIDIHALGHTWNGQAYWLVVAGLAAMLIAALGLALVQRGGALRYRRRTRVAEAPVANRVVETPATRTANGDVTDTTVDDTTVDDPAVGSRHRRRLMRS
jgi:uncharacterized membrane protein